MKINSKFIIEHVEPVLVTTAVFTFGFFFGAKLHMCIPDWKIYLLFFPLFVLSLIEIYSELSELKRLLMKRNAAQSGK